MSATDPLERLAELHPEGTAELRRAGAVARASADPELLALCLAHAEAILTGAAVAGRGPRDDRERAFVDLAEQFATSVAGVSEAQVEALLAHATAEEVYAFIGALYVLELTRRVEIVAAAVLP